MIVKIPPHSRAEVTFTAEYVQVEIPYKAKAKFTALADGVTADGKEIKM
jgi:hypothetical protein